MATHTITKAAVDTVAAAVAATVAVARAAAVVAAVAVAVVVAVAVARAAAAVAAVAAAVVVRACTRCCGRASVWRRQRGSLSLSCQLSLWLHLSLSESRHPASVRVSRARLLRPQRGAGVVQP